MLELTCIFEPVTHTALSLVAQVHPRHKLVPAEENLFSLFLFATLALPNCFVFFYGLREGNKRYLPELAVISMETQVFLVTLPNEGYVEGSDLSMAVQGQAIFFFFFVSFATISRDKEHCSSSVGTYVRSMEKMQLYSIYFVSLILIKEMFLWCHCSSQKVIRSSQYVANVNVKRGVQRDREEGKERGQR